MIQTMGDRILHGFFHAPNNGDYSHISELYASEAVIHTLDGDKKGPDVIIGIFSKWKVAFSDFQLEPLNLSEEGDVLVVHWRGKGTFIHPIRELPPTGKEVVLHGFTCFRCKDNQIVEHWARVDYHPLSQNFH